MSFHGLERHNERWQGMHYITVGDVKTRNNLKVLHRKRKRLSIAFKTNPTPTTRKEKNNLTDSNVIVKWTKAVSGVCQINQSRGSCQKRRGRPVFCSTERDVCPRTGLNRFAGFHRDGRRQSLGSHVPGGPRGPGEPGGPGEVIPGGPWQEIRHY